MAVDNKYGEIEIEGIPADEPVFVLRAQDRLSTPILIRYQNMATVGECSDEFIKGIDQAFSNFADWQIENKDKVKTPD